MRWNDNVRRNVGGTCPSRAERTNNTAQRPATTQSVVGVDAHIDPAVGNRRIARIFGENVKRSVGADASVRPRGNHKFAATFHQNGHALCGAMWASPPTNVVRIRIGASVFVGAFRRADRVVRPYGCMPFRIGARGFAMLCRAGGAEPRPYVTTKNAKNHLKFPPRSAIILLRKSSQENRVAAMRKSGFFGLTLIFLQGDGFS